MPRTNPNGVRRLCNCPGGWTRCTLQRSAFTRSGDTMASRVQRFWLFKVEPSVFSIDDLAAAPDQTTSWEGVRNYQVRNYLRDEITVGDGVLFYHSNTEPPAVVGRAEVVRAGYPDRYQFEIGHTYFDPKADPANPRWYMVDIRYVDHFAAPISISELRSTPGLENMELLRKGSRLSITPVTADEWRIVTARGTSGAPVTSPLLR